MTKARKAGLLFACGLAVLAALQGISGAQQPTGGAISAYRAVYENVSGTLGRFRFDTTNNFFVFGSSGGVAGAVLTSSGTAVIQSTSTVSTNPVLQIRNAAGAILGSWQQGGNLQLVTGQFLGDGSALAGLPGLSSTSTWTGTQQWAQIANFFSSVNLSSATSYFNSSSSVTFGGLFTDNAPAVFNSSVTVGPTVVSSTASFSRVVLGDWSLILSTHPVASSSQYIYGLQALSPTGGGSVLYRVEINIHQNASTGILYGRFNDDAGAGLHNYANSGETSGNASNINATDTACALSYRTGNPAGVHEVSTFYFAPDPASGTQIDGHAELTAATPGIINQSCQYTGAIGLKSLKIFDSAGTFTGDIAVFAMLVP